MARVARADARIANALQSTLARLLALITLATIVSLP